jgi:hypothetical protein
LSCRGYRFSVNVLVATPAAVRLPIPTGQPVAVVTAPTERDNWVSGKTGSVKCPIRALKR